MERGARAPKARLEIHSILGGPGSAPEPIVPRRHSLFRL